MPVQVSELNPFLKCIIIVLSSPLFILLQSDGRLTYSGSM
jgi:hypothetical protein